MVLILPTNRPDHEGGTKCRRADMAAAIESALTLDQNIDSSEIAVTVLGDYVILEGRVDERRDMAHAVEVAASIAGRRHVVNRMFVRWENYSPGAGWHRH